MMPHRHDYNLHEKKKKGGGGGGRSASAIENVSETINTHSKGWKVTGNVSARRALSFDSHERYLLKSSLILIILYRVLNPSLLPIDNPLCQG